MRQFMLTLWNTYSFWVLYAEIYGPQVADVDQLPVAGRSDLP